MYVHFKINSQNIIRLKKRDVKGANHSAGILGIYTLKNVRV